MAAARGVIGNVGGAGKLRGRMRGLHTTEASWARRWPGAARLPRLKLLLSLFKSHETLFP